MFQHLSVARQQVFVVHGLQKLCAEYDSTGIREHTNLVLQSSEVKTRLAAYRGIDHSKQRCWYINIVDASLECRGSKAAKVGHHSATQVDEQRVPRATQSPQLPPYMGD